jgi:hypothetical protein
MMNRTFAIGETVVFQPVAENWRPVSAMRW